jgi:hypothetical protein
LKPEPRSLVEQVNDTGPDKPKQLLFVWRDAIRCDRTITAEDYRVALEYSMYADMDGTNCWPGEARIAGALRRAERSVRRRVAKLVKRGWMTLEQRGHGGGPGKSKPAVYRLTIPQDIGHTCPVCPTTAGHWCPRHRTWVTETPDTRDQDIGHSYGHLPPITSPDLSYRRNSKREPESDELEDTFTSERADKERSEGDRADTEPGDTFTRERREFVFDDVDALKQRCIETYTPWGAARDHCVRTIDALRRHGDRGIADSVISEALGLAADQGDKDPAKRTLAYLFGAAVGQYRRATGGAS